MSTSCPRNRRIPSIDTADSAGMFSRSTACLVLHSRVHRDEEANMTAPEHIVRDGTVAAFVVSANPPRTDYLTGTRYLEIE